MKVIDLLNKMANGEPLPNKIKLQCVNGITEDNNTYKFNPLLENYMNNKGTLLTSATYFHTLLDLEIEIIEEDKPIEKLTYDYKNIYGNKSKCKHSEIRIIDKVNEIIDKLERGKEE